MAWIEGFGSCRGGLGRVTARTVFAVASLSKPPFAHLVLRLCDRGVLDLEAPLVEIWPDAVDLLPDAVDSELRTITARQVLSHTSGLGNWDGEQVGRILFSPGARWQYSGEGYVFLQRVVEHVTGRSLRELAREELFRPLGMESTTYLWRPSVGAANRGDEQECDAEGHRFSRAYASHSLHTTAREYARFVIRATESGAGSAAFEPQVCIDGSLAWGLGWGLFDELVWQWGEMDHYACAAVASMRDGRGLVCLTNGDEGLSACGDILECALGTTFARPIREVVERGW